VGVRIYASVNWSRNIPPLMDKKDKQPVKTTVHVMPIKIDGSSPSITF